MAMWPKHPKWKNEFVFRFSYFTFENENEKGIRFLFFVRKFENEKGIRFLFFVRKFENEKGIRFSFAKFENENEKGIRFSFANLKTKKENTVYTRTDHATDRTVQRSTIPSRRKVITFIKSTAITAWQHGNVERKVPCKLPLQSVYTSYVVSAFIN